MIGGFSWRAGITYAGAAMAPGQVDAGTGVVNVSDFTVFNRSPRPLHLKTAYCNLRRNASVANWGLAAPRESFITCPIRNFSAASLPAR